MNSLPPLAVFLSHIWFPCMMYFSASQRFDLYMSIRFTLLTVKVKENYHVVNGSTGLIKRRHNILYVHRFSDSFKHQCIL